MSGRAQRDGYEDAPSTRLFDHAGTRAHDAELKILESAARRITRSDFDGVLEVFSELPPCASCGKAFEQFHVLYPNVQVRIYSRLDVLAG